MEKVHPSSDHPSTSFTLNYLSRFAKNWGFRAVTYAASGALATNYIVSLTLQQGLFVSLANATLMTAYRMGSLDRRVKTRNSMRANGTVFKAVVIGLSTFVLTHNKDPIRYVGVQLSGKMIACLAFFHLLSEIFVKAIYHDAPPVPQSPPDIKQLGSLDLRYIFEHWKPYDSKLTEDNANALIIRFIKKKWLPPKTPASIAEVKVLNALEISYIHDFPAVYGSMVLEMKTDVLKELHTRFFQEDLSLPNDQTLTSALANLDSFSLNELPIPDTVEDIACLSDDQLSWLALSTCKFGRINTQSSEIETALKGVFKRIRFDWDKRNSG